jgi:hypothetical protein
LCSIVNFFTFSKNNKGSALAQVMLISSLISGLALTFVISLEKDQVNQAQQVIQNNLFQKRDEIVTLINDSESWQRTVNFGLNNFTLMCLRNFSSGLTCDESSFAPLDEAQNTEVIAGQTVFRDNSFFENTELPILRRLVRADGSIFLLNGVGALDEGFRDDGEPCNTFNFNLANGDPDCPAKWVVRFQFLCPGAAATCKNPEIRFVILLYYNPGPNKRPEQIINPFRFRVIFTRGQTGPIRNEVFEASFGNNAGGGPCTPLGWRKISLNNLIDLNSPQNSSLNAGSVRVGPGSYVCSAAATCWECGSLKVRLTDESSNRILATSPTVLAGNGILGSAMVKNFSFIVNGESQLGIYQYCERQSPTNNLFSMGIPIFDYSSNTFANLRCTRVH